MLNSRKFSVNFFSGSSVKLVRCFWCLRGTKIPMFSAYHYLCNPMFSTTPVSDAFKAGCIVTLFFFIAAIFAIVGGAQVIPAVIAAISVFVVYFIRRPFVRNEQKYYAMKEIPDTIDLDIKISCRSAESGDFFRNAIVRFPKNCAAFWVVPKKLLSAFCGKIGTKFHSHAISPGSCWSGAGLSVCSASRLRMPWSV